MEIPTISTVIGRFRNNTKYCIEWLKIFYVDKSSVPSDLVMRTKIVRTIEKDKHLVKSKWNR